MQNSSNCQRDCRPIRVLLVDHTAAIGGGELALLNFARHADRMRIEPVVLLFADGPLAERLRPEVETHILPLDQRILSTRKETLGAASLLKVGTIFHLVTLSLRVYRFIRKQNIDLIHTNSLKSDIVGGIAGRLARKPVMWHVRDRISADYLPSPAVRAFRFLAGVIPTDIVTNSAATLETIGSAARRVKTAHVVHEGVDLKTMEYAPPVQIRTFGLIGRISPWKGQHIFIQAAADVNRRYPETRFFIIGAALFGEEAYEAQIRKMTEELGLNRALEFTGFRADVHKRTAALDVVVHASTSGEPFGQVIVEGMAAGKPVIATNGGGVPEIVEDGRTGILVPMGDSHAMAAAMMQLLDRPEWAAELGIRGRKRVEDYFTVQGTADRISALFETISRREAKRTRKEFSD